MIIGDEPLKTHITKYYKFFWVHQKTVTLLWMMVENDFLTLGFTEDEVRTTIFRMEHNKAPGPDGFPTEFYQAFWDVNM
jgi:hypothetical protein